MRNNLSRLSYDSVKYERQCYPAQQSRNRERKRRKRYVGTTGRSPFVFDLTGTRKRGQETPGASLALQKRHAQAHQVVEGIPMHHVLAAIHNVKVDLRLLFLQQFGAFTGVSAVFAAKNHQ